MATVASLIRVQAILLAVCLVGYIAGLGLGILQPCSRLGLTVQTIAIVLGVIALLLIAKGAFVRRSWRMFLGCLALGIVLFVMFGATGMTCAVA